jgi:hypothetical protein
MKVMPIYYNKLTLRLRNYSIKKGELYLSKKSQQQTIESVCIGNTLETLNNKKYNSSLMKRLKERLCKKNGCEIEITKVETISHHGNTVQKFKD